MEITSTKKTINYIKCILYGKSGVGKTVTGATAPKPIFLDCEKGLLSISHLDIPVIQIEDFEDLDEAYDFLDSKKAKNFETVVIDSGSEVAELVLLDLKKEYKDTRQAYMDLGERTIKVLRAFRDLPKHVVIICKEKQIESDGVEIHKPSFPGQALVEKVPYLVDEVFALRIDEEDPDKRYLQTQPSFDWDAKDRSGKLSKTEEPDLSKVFKKILKDKKKKV